MVSSDAGANADRRRLLPPNVAVSHSHGRARSSISGSEGRVVDFLGAWPILNRSRFLHQEHRHGTCRPGLLVERRLPVLDRNLPLRHSISPSPSAYARCLSPASLPITPNSGKGHLPPCGPCLNSVLNPKASKLTPFARDAWSRNQIARLPPDFFTALTHSALAARRRPPHGLRPPPGPRRD